jgi:hypothetical protein
MNAWSREFLEENSSNSFLRVHFHVTGNLTLFTRICREVSRAEKLFSATSC